MPPTLKQYARLAAAGALAVAAGSFGLFLLLAFATRSSVRSGIDPTQAVVTWISLAVPIALVVAIHVAYARVLAKYAKE